ncbi:MAG: acetylpolyamine aminohydrolase [Nitrococcus sp.]|nr:acetylpolyamine aminohydrolase [Nitrococcus sp.]
MRTDSIPLFVPALHAQHQPRRDLSDGYPGVDHPEVPDRVDRVLEGLAAAWDVDVQTVADLAWENVRRLHDADYIRFLVELSERLHEGEQYIPAIFHSDLSVAPLRLRGGMYCKETGTPISAATLSAALCSAAAAERAAQALIETGRDAVALCRPPGHHAGRRRYGGYCLFNNAYVAAEILARVGRCAVLDLDYHLGEGSAELSSERTPYFSLHADPWRNYPYLDVGMLPGSAFATLESVPSGVDGSGYLERLRRLLEPVEALDLDFLVLSLGFDTAATDPIQDDPVRLHPQDYLAIGQALARLRPRIAIVLEGGYDLDGLSGCARYFAAGFCR